jgi:Ca2+/Na+ antiporter
MVDAAPTVFAEGAAGAVFVVPLLGALEEELGAPDLVGGATLTARGAAAPRVTSLGTGHTPAGILAYKLAGIP